MGEGRKKALRVVFDRSLKLEFRLTPLLRQSVWFIVTNLSGPGRRHAIGAWIFNGRVRLALKMARRWIRAKVKWEMSGGSAGALLRGSHGSDAGRFENRSWHRASCADSAARPSQPGISQMAGLQVALLAFLDIRMAVSDHGSANPPRG